MRRMLTYFAIACSLLIIASLSACTSETDSAGGDTRTVLMMPFSQRLCDAETGMRRVLPTGFTPVAMAPGTSMIGFFTPNSGQSVAARIFTSEEDSQHWMTNITVDDTSEPCYIYGFMPVGAETTTDVSISLPGGMTSYRQGALMSIGNLKALSAKDPCVVVGVKKGSSLTAPIEDTDIRQGQFAYTFEAATRQEYVYMLFDHVMEALDVQMKVSSSYSLLRQIRLKELQIVPLTAKTVDATVHITATDDGTTPLTGSSPVAFSVKTAGEGEPVRLYKTAEGGDDCLLTTDYQQVGTCFAATNITRFRMAATYDVYDRAGNLIREGCSAENTFNLGVVATELKPGVKHHLLIEVNPTFLYVLSDPDLDNPTFTVTNN